MPSTPTPRPMPGPIPHPRPRPYLAALPVEPVDVPGFGAMIRRHPMLTQRAALASIAAGVVTFVVASVALPLAGADSPARAVAHADAYTPQPLLQLPPPITTADPASGASAGAAAPRASHPAPADTAAISTLAANGIPRVALNAYRVAAARMANVDPSCGLDWSLLAGIGRVESDHGQFAGAVLHTDGISTPRIIGPALDGKRWDYIPAPGNGLALDGDAKYAHALGPMQFIPSTWAIYGADATGDGKADIFNINDAALGTARYLCAAGGDLRSQAGKARAVLAYNHNSTYLLQVLALADAYHRGLRVTGIPIVGITKGGLPTIVDTGYVPPANPGDPTAVDKSGSTGKSGAPSGGSSSSPKPSSSAPKPTSSTSSAPAPSSSAPTSTPSAPVSSTSKACTKLAHLLHLC